MVSLIGEVLINRALPSRQRIAAGAGKFLKDVAKKPIQTIKTGIARDRAAVNLMRSSTGITRRQAVTNMFPALVEGAYKGGGKDLLVNTGGVVGSAVGGSGGVAGSLVGDWIGARVARKALDDTEAVGKALKIRSNPNFQKLSPMQRANIVRRRAQGFARGNLKNELLEDTTGWGIGNGAAMGLSSLGVGVPLKGAAVAIGTSDNAVKGINAGRRYVRRTGSVLGGVRASVVATGRGLRRKYSVNRALGREQKMYDSVNDTLQRRLPQLPAGVDFNRSTSFLADFSQKQRKTNRLKLA